jgi:hypothetical protein
MLKQDGPRIAIAKFKSERACSAAEGIDAEQVCDVLMLADHYARPQLRTMALNFAVENCIAVQETEGWTRLPLELMAEVREAWAAAATDGGAAADRGA